MKNIMIDLHFQIQGETIQVDHGYALFSVISHCVQEFHTENDVRLALIRGEYIGNGKLQLQPYSRLILRLPVKKMGLYIKLAGKTFDLNGHKIWVGGALSQKLIPATALYAHIVTTKNGLERDRFMAEVRRQLDERLCLGSVSVGRRRVFSIHGKKVIGYSLLISELTAEESLMIQEQGVGGRRKMGCGFFQPWYG